MQRNLSTIILAATLFAFPGLSSIAYAEPAIGQPAPALAAKELDGSPFDLGAMRGRVVIVHFWATWCSSCREEMGVLDSYYRSHHAEGLEVIAVDVEKPRKRDDVLAMMKPLAFPAAMMDDMSANGFGRPGSLPVTYIIDRAGVLRARLTPEEHLLTPELLADRAGTLLNTPQNGK